jgi:hypothetical protein
VRFTSTGDVARCLYGVNSGRSSSKARRQTASSRIAAQRFQPRPAAAMKSTNSRMRGGAGRPCTIAHSFDHPGATDTLVQPELAQFANGLRSAKPGKDCSGAPRAICPLRNLKTLGIRTSLERLKCANSGRSATAWRTAQIDPNRANRIVQTSRISYGRDDVGLDLARHWSRPELLGDCGCRSLCRLRQAIGIVSLDLIPHRCPLAVSNRY